MAEPKVFRLLLALYPPSFRRAYGDDVLAAMHLRLEEMYRAGPRRLRLGTVLLRDLCFSLPRAWLTHGFGRRRAIYGSPLKESNLMNTLLSDLRYTLRRLLHQPSTAIIAVLAVALGIGLTTAMFSIVNGVILKGLPFDQPDEILAIFRINPSESQGRLIARIHDYRDTLERQTTFDQLAAIAAAAANVSAPGHPPEFVPAAQITASMWPLLGVEPEFGRVFGVEAEILGGPDVAVVGHQFWRERLDADPGVVGRTIRINGAPTTILGVMPDGFEFPFTQQLWQPLRVDIDALPRNQSPNITLVGRLRDGVSVAQGQADLHRIMDQLADEFPETNTGMTWHAAPYVREAIGYQIPQFLFTMLGAVSMVLVIACANVANLLLARASQRTKEVAISSALGASRSRVFFQLMMEAFVIASVGSALGVFVAKVGIDQFNDAIETFALGVPFWFAISIDVPTLIFVVVLTVAASLVSGMIPAFKASGADTNEILKDATRGNSGMRIGRLSRALVLLEVAASCALLVAAGLMIRSVVNLVNEDYAFNADGVFTAGLSLPLATYPTQEDQARFYDQLGERLRAIPGVEGATVASDLPVVGFSNGRFAIEGRTYQQDRDYASTRMAFVDASYFDTLDIDLLDGRDFEPTDGLAELPVMIVNESFVTLHLAGDSALGQRVAIRGVSELGQSQQNNDLYYTVVGVVPDQYIESQLFGGFSNSAIYVPLAQRPTTGVSVALRTAGDPLELTRPVREVVTALDPDIPIVGQTTLRQALQQTTLFLRVFAVMFMIFGGVALFLATIGLYGVLSFAVSQRTHEVGLRIALGATANDVVRLVLRQGFGQLVGGLAVGLVMALGLGSLMSVVLYDVSATDPLVMTAIVVILMTTGLVACYIPARRATRVDPIDAMRLE